jgi:glycosyltransferase involved in cell wall biosynthesis
VTKRIKVLQLQLRFNIGISSLADQAIQGLPADRFEVTNAFLSGQPGPEDNENTTVKSICFNFKKSELKGWRRLKALWRLYKHCRDEQYDVVIAHRFKPINMLMLLNRKLKIPVCIGVQHGIGDFDRFLRRLEARFLMRSNWKTVGVSRAVCDYLVSCHGGFNLGNIVQINNAIDIERAEKIQLTRTDARAALGLEPDAYILGCIGRLVPVKGHVFLVEAFSRIQKDYSDVHVAIIGEGRSRQVLENAIDKYGVQGRVHLLGARDDALQYVRAFNALVMPSLSEGLPLALLEGMSGHLPVIGSNIDSLRQILEDCGGQMFETGNVESLTSELVSHLKRTEQEHQAKGEQAYAYLCDSHNIHGFRQQYRDLIEGMLPSGREA